MDCRNHHSLAVILCLTDENMGLIEKNWLNQ